MPERRFGDALARLVRKRLRDVLRDAPGALARGRAGDLHELRIAVKGLRYTLEFAAPLARDEVERALDLLALLQERLGRLADADVFARTYAALRERVPAADERRVGLDTLFTSAERECERALEAIRALWQGDGAPYPERLAASISTALDSLSPKLEA